MVLYFIFVEAKMLDHSYAARVVKPLAIGILTVSLTEAADYGKKFNINMESNSYFSKTPKFQCEPYKVQLFSFPSFRQRCS